MRDRPIAAIAFGGNVITRSSEQGTIREQFANTHRLMEQVARVLRAKDCRLLITHGNGPQIGNILLRTEMTRQNLPLLPLDICVADSQGGMGYMIAQVLHNTLLDEGQERPIATLITQVVVDPNDPAFKEPSKPIGQFHSKQEAERLQAEFGWRMVEDAGRGWRRVVASPRPTRIVEVDAVRALLKQDIIVVASGGGGIPVIENPEDHTLEGVAAVIDKDYAISSLAAHTGVHDLYILTGVDRVCLDYGKSNEHPLERLTADEAEEYLRQGHFPPGSMGPKIEAAIDFLNSGGERVFIGRPEAFEDMVFGRVGTLITASVN